MAESDLTSEEEEEVSEKAEDVYRNYIEAKDTIPAFFKEVVMSDDTTKTGNIKEEELGNPSHTIRAYKELGVFCRDIANDNYWADYFDKIAEVNLATSLSDRGFLLKLVGTSRKEVADVTRRRKHNRGWFKGNKNKDKEEEGGEE